MPPSALGRDGPCRAIQLHPTRAHIRPFSVDPAPRLHELPRELVELICCKLSPRDLCALQRTNRAFRHLPREDKIWQRFCERSYHTPPEFVSAFGLTWKQAYRLHRQALLDMVRSTSSQMAGLRLTGGAPFVLQVR